MDLKEAVQDVMLWRRENLRYLGREGLATSAAIVLLGALERAFTFLDGAWMNKEQEAFLTELRAAGLGPKREPYTVEESTHYFGVVGPGGRLVVSVLKESELGNPGSLGKARDRAGKIAALLNEEESKSKPWRPGPDFVGVHRAKYPVDY